MFQNSASKLIIFATVATILGIIGGIFFISSMAISTILKIVLIIAVAISIWGNALVLVTFAEMAENIETMSYRLHDLSSRTKSNERHD
ncbi:MAG: hypothetical protein K2G88_02315 [Oscillospiraceae bacterium]|nr:hypothetical protein [Oscillospiraceae bacterium]